MNSLNANLVAPGIGWSGDERNMNQGPIIPAVRRKPVPMKSSATYEVVAPAESDLDSGMGIGEVHPPRVYWLTTSLIIVSVISGTLSALVHHLFYSWLNVQPAVAFSSEWAVRVGTGLAFLTKALLVAAATISYQQYYWIILRRKALSLGDIDGIMNILGNPAAFVDSRIVRNARSAAIVALVIWCLPLMVIAPPATLTVGSQTTETTFPDSAVPLVNWSRLPSMMFPNGSGLWADAGQDIYRMTASTAYGGSVLPMTPTYANYSYPLTFYGPRLRCTKLNKDDLDTFSKVFKPSYSWVSELHLDPIFQYGGNLLLLYNATDVFSSNPSNSSWPNKYRFDFWVLMHGHKVTCQSWNVSYNTKFEFKNGVQNIRVENVSYVSRLMPDNPKVINQGPMIGCASWFKALSTLLKGRIGIGGYPITKIPLISSHILQTSLAACPEMQKIANMITAPFKTNFKPRMSPCPGGSLMNALEQLSENITLSYFSYGVNMATVNVPLTVTKVDSVYRYNSYTLLTSYTTAISATLVIVLLGFNAIYQNGMTHSTSFSAILCSTRNPDLDHLASGHWYAGQPLAKTLEKQKVQFGMLHAGPSLTHNHVGFGIPGTVTKLKRQ